MLPVHEHIVSEVLQEDGLVVIGAGLGLVKVLASILRLHSPPDGSVFILSASDSQKQAIKEELLEQGQSVLPDDINNDYLGPDRLALYAQGGYFFITSRILIVDMLNERVPLDRVLGLVVLNAHNLSEACAEAFIARLYRAANRRGFIRAFSDKPQAMIAGFSKTERIMRCLFVRKLHLWPRFQMSVAAALEENPPEVIDIRVPLSPSMQGINAAILEVMDACLKELRKTNKVDVEDLTVENGLFKSFHEMVHRQLDPIWHTLSWKTKQLVWDLKTLRKLADSLICYDAVTFLKYLDTLRASEDVRSVWIFANPSYKIFELAKRRVFQVVKSDSTGNCKESLQVNKSNRGGGKGGRRNVITSRSSTLQQGSVYHEEVDLLERDIKRRKLMESNMQGTESSIVGDRGGDSKVKDCTVPSSSGDAGNEGVEVVVMAEEMPKWKLLLEVLEEIEADLRQSKSETPVDLSDESAGPILVACKDERTCLQLQDCVRKGPQKLISDEWDKYLLGKAELHGMRTRRRKEKSLSSRGVGILNGRAPGKTVKEDDVSTARQEEDALLAAAHKVSAHAEGNEGRGARRGKLRGRGRGRKDVAGRGKQKLLIDTAGSDAAIDTISKSSVMQKGSLEPAVETTVPVTEAGHGEPGRQCLPLHFYALESEQRILDILRPSFIIVYDPDMGFVRQMEVYKAEYSDRPLKVYFFFYENSTEVQKFEASIRRENSAFESLIKQKALMMIPVDQDGRLLDSAADSPSPSLSTRKAGGRKGPEKTVQVVVDMREFGSSLPCVLHQQGLRIVPVTLEVGDYILSPDICVERKSIADLIGSFSSGRLYHQAETMTRYYRIPVLLIEFSQDKSFSLQSANDVRDDISPSNIISKICLLVLHFPRLRLVWSRSLHATAELFIALKSNQDEPDVDKAMKVGVPTEDGLIEGDLRAENYNVTAVELLRRLPGVTDANYRSLMDGCNSLAELSCLPLDMLADLMGGHRPARMLRDFLDAKCPNII